MRFKPTDLHCYIIIIVAFILYPVFNGIRVMPAGDTHDYVEAAKIISSGYHQIAFRVPVYPLLLIVTGSVNRLNTSLFFAQYLLYFVSVFLLVAAMIRSAIDKRLLVIITLLLVSPLLVQMVYQVMTEAISFALANIIFALYILLKGKYKFLLLGLLSAVLTLTRPSFQLTGLLLTIFFLLSEKRKVLPVLFFASFAIPLFIFSLFNKERFNFFGITPATGWHLTTKTALFIDQWPDTSMRPLMIRERNENLVTKTSHTGSMFVWSLPQLIQDTLHLNYVDASKYMMKNNTALIKSHPLEYLSAVGRSLVDYTFPNAVVEKGSGLKKALYAIIQFFYVYLFLILSALVLACTWLFRRKIDDAWLHPFVLAAIIIFSNYFVSIAAEVGSSRHRAPTEGLILVAIAFALPIVVASRRAIKLHDVKVMSAYD
ncbi:hypothetical protein [Segetibacter aerophilus]|uniref:Glycosyltransferase RgtA/B/C/D-like domain-containing protein n=1 Tax=Segetibacter aerophilus TaxID=670293 RepID=A0A512BDA0_9BACT|nr:hypothetical protein [Segetibacter aerophilus]GEO09941.1 hypothetical protein SAE01_24370 [Segetibacter aerophilus]